MPAAKTVQRLGVPPLEAQCAGVQGQRGDHARHCALLEKTLASHSCADTILTWAGSCMQHRLQISGAAACG